MGFVRNSQLCVFKLTVNVSSGSKLDRILLDLRENLRESSFVILDFKLSTALILNLDFIKSSLSDKDGLIIVPNTNVLN